MQQKITPNLWFNGNALEAAEYYQSVFPDGKITSVVKYPNSVEEGLAEFQLSEAVSFQVDCKDQAEIDYYWEKLSAVPQAEQCGWCKDKFGLSWQIVPKNMEQLMQKPGAFSKMMQMHKLVIADF